MDDENTFQKRWLFAKRNSRPGFHAAFSSPIRSRMLWMTVPTLNNHEPKSAIICELRAPCGSNGWYNRKSGAAFLRELGRRLVHESGGKRESGWLMQRISAALIPGPILT